MVRHPPGMSYYVESRWGGSEQNPSAARMAELLAELDVPDPEHPDTWLEHESGWTLNVHEKGVISWDSAVLDVEPRHIANISRSRALALWQSLARGDIEAIEREQWQPGNGIPSLTADERREAEAARARIDCDFYDSLGAEIRGALLCHGMCTWRCRCQPLLSRSSLRTGARAARPVHSLRTAH